MPMTEARRLIDAYLSRGGKRRVKIDDNITSVRQWDDEPEEAERFWVRYIASLSEEKRREVELLLPTINST
ncbi:hypothetical protein [Allorhizobium undicola]|uniref:hypothetical protein n=1 Tax=Allorhizobium undicola TaxID=78527 RepID=UPI000487FCE0|nr:hypothetical protein [Allorhizobium undicola]